MDEKRSAIELRECGVGVAWRKAGDVNYWVCMDCGHVSHEPLKRGCGGIGVLAVDEIASRLGVSEQRVRQLISSGALPARKRGSYWYVPAPLVEEFASKERKPGRPAKV